MSIVRYTLEEIRRMGGQINWEVVDATTEEDIARHASEDDSSTADLDFDAMLADGRIRLVPAPLDVAAIRHKTGLSQERFARAFQISPHTLRNWEQGRRTPEGPARALLQAIDRDPEALLRALGANAA